MRGRRMEEGEGRDAQSCVEDEERRGHGEAPVLAHEKEGRHWPARRGTASPVSLCARAGPERPRSALRIRAFSAPGPRQIGALVHHSRLPS